MAIERRKPRDRAANYGKLPDTVDRVEYLREALRHAESMVTQAEEARSWQAAVSAKRLALQTRDELDLALAKAASPDDTMSDEQLLAIMMQAIGYQLNTSNSSSSDAPEPATLALFGTALAGLAALRRRTQRTV